MRSLPFRSAADLPVAVCAVREVLEDHGVVAIPTETFYGLAANPWDEQAVAKVFSLKARETKKALLVVAADLAQVEQLAVLPPLWRQRLGEVWPAPLTVVLEARTPLPGSGATVAVRVPAHDLLRALLAQVGPLTATSANRTGNPPAQEVGELGWLAGAVDLVLDGGRSFGGLPSTLLDAVAVPPRILREGAFTVPEHWLVGSENPNHGANR